MQEFASRFSTALEAKLLSVANLSSEKVGFSLFGCRDTHVAEDGVKHYCFSVLVMFTRMVRLRDLNMLSFPLLCSGLHVCTPSFFQRTLCLHKHAGFCSFLYSCHSWIAAAPPGQVFGASFFCWSCSTTGTCARHKSDNGAYTVDVRSGEIVLCRDRRRGRDQGWGPSESGGSSGLQAEEEAEEDAESSGST